MSEERRFSLFCLVVLATLCARPAAAAPGARDTVSQGNALYSQGQYDRAVSLYDQALTENPRLDQARFNKADAFFRMDDLAKAMDLYSEVSAQTKDMDLVKKAKYNLGNAHFQRGLKQRDSDLQKALEDLRTSITYWRAVLDMDPSNANAKKNKEIAGLIIKDILDELKKKQEEQKQDPNQTQNTEEKNQGQDPNQKPEEKKQGQDPNQTQNSERRTQNTEENKQSQEPNKSEQRKQGQDPNQAKDPNPQPATRNPQPQMQASDATAQEILDREQQQKKERENHVRTQRVPVDKDW